MGKGSARREEDTEAVRRNWPFSETAFERRCREDREAKQAEQTQQTEEHNDN